MRAYTFMLTEEQRATITATLDTVDGHDDGQRLYRLCETYSRVFGKSEERTQLVDEAELVGA